MLSTAEPRGAQNEDLVARVQSRLETNPLLMEKTLESKALPAPILSFPYALSFGSRNFGSGIYSTVGCRLTGWG
jgi:hypothetical protein